MKITRDVLVQQLRDAGYAGPVSYTMTRLHEIAALHGAAPAEPAEPTFEDLSDYKTWLKANPDVPLLTAARSGIIPPIAYISKYSYSSYWEVVPRPPVNNAGQRPRLFAMPTDVPRAPITVKGNRYWVQVDAEYAVAKCKENDCDHPADEDEEMCRTHLSRVRKEQQKRAEQQAEYARKQAAQQKVSDVIAALKDATGVRASTAYAPHYWGSKSSVVTGIAVSTTAVNDFIAMYTALQTAGIEVPGLSEALTKRMKGEEE
ncbi:MAG TPA: hypothetical protein PLB92_05920 [Rhodoglobus sp.]|nr:hypothetical protein [Rhodoglobus sp.]